MSDESLRIILEIPPAELRGNFRGHTRVKAFRVKAYRETTFKLALAGKGTWVAPPKAIRRLHWFFPDRRQRDLDNFAAGLKAAMDAFCLAGLLVGDHWEVLSHGGVEVSIDRENPRVEILIERLK